MGKKSKKKKNHSNWVPPKGASAYFYASSDEDFKRRHPWGYFFLVLLGLTALMGPVVLYCIYAIPIADNSPWLMLGWIGAFIVGVGLFNFVAIIIQQYLGHLVSILSFIIGGILVILSLYLM